MKVRRLQISDPNSARLTLSGLQKIRQTASRLVVKSETVRLRDSERVEFKMQLGKMILTCDEFIMAIVKESKDTKVDKDSILTEIDDWREFLGPERVAAPMILISNEAEDYIIYSDEDFAKLVLEQMNQVLDEIHEIIEIIDESSCSDDQKQELRAMVGYLVGMFNAIHMPIFIDHPSLIPDDDWREMVEDVKKNRPYAI